jgi:hypothetical protein
MIGVKVTTTTGGERKLSADDLLNRSPVELDALFQDSPAGPIPRGRAHGTIVAFPGRFFAAPLSRVLGALAWHGKDFHTETGDLHNLISPVGVEAIRARVYEQGSWLDDRPCVVLDYSQTSTVAGWIRDEIREVSPGVYLGLVWGVGRLFGGHRLVLRFVLTFETQEQR